MLHREALVRDGKAISAPHEPDAIEIADVGLPLPGCELRIVDDADQSVLAWLRLGGPDDAPVAVTCNFTLLPRVGFRLGLPEAGRWREAFNSDAVDYGGSGLGNLGSVVADATSSHGFPASAQITIPPLATVYFVLERP